jgi:hypothetical protein
MFVVMVFMISILNHERLEVTYEVIDDTVVALDDNIKSLLDVVMICLHVPIENYLL